MRETGNAAERYAFRTPALRNVELTAPYGHDGAIVDLRDFVDHYSESDLKLRSFDANQLEEALRAGCRWTGLDRCSGRLKDQAPRSDPRRSVLGYYYSAG